jgi:hypothetical protein
MSGSSPGWNEAEPESREEEQLPFVACPGASLWIDPCDHALDNFDNYPPTIRHPFVEVMLGRHVPQLKGTIHIIIFIQLT